jgi:cellulose synthase/poly-beta-1,6-N-acetylglucosamine synthase-like glycosyltransferase
MNQLITIIVYITLFIGIFTLIMCILSFFGREKPKFKSIGQPFVSILIPAYNEELSLGKTVESVIALDYPKNKYEIIIIDDGSGDKTPKIGRELAKKYKNIIYLRKKNGGKGSALNYGIEKAKGEFIVTFDADSMVNKDALSLMIPHFSNPRVMAVTPAMKVYNPKKFLQRIQAVEYDLGIFFRESFGNMNAINVTPGPFSIIRKEFFEKYGGYRTDVLTEDMEMAMRIQKHDYFILNEPRAVVYTISPESFGSLLKQRRRWYAGTVFLWTTYKNLFSPRYGYFGLFILPLAVLSVITTIIVTSYYTTRLLIDSYHNISNYRAIGFDFFNSLSFKLNYLLIHLYNSLAEGILFFIVLFSVFTVVLLIILDRRIGVSNPIKAFINYLLFAVTYSVLYTIWWGVSIFYSITGREVKWK